MRKVFARTRWVKLPRGKGWQPTASESCVVVRDGGTKRRQWVSKPCNRATKRQLSQKPSLSKLRGQHRCFVMPEAQVLPGSKSRAKVRVGSMGTWENPAYPVDQSQWGIWVNIVLAVSLRVVEEN